MKQRKNYLVPLLIFTLALSILVPTVSAINYDPSKPPITIQNQSNYSTGDEDPWGELQVYPNINTQRNLFSIFSRISIVIYDLYFNINNKNIQNNRFHPDVDIIVNEYNDTTENKTSDSVIRGR